MSLEFENMDDFEPEKTQSMELEEYGVWVKKETPEIAENILSDDDIFNPDYFQEIIENSPQEQETEIVEKTVDNLVDIPTDSPVLNNLETEIPEIPDIPAESTDTILDEISSDAQVNANDFDIENLASEIDGLDLSAFENQFEEKVIDAKNDEIKDNQEFMEETKNKSFDELPAGFDIPDLSNLTEEIDLSSFMSDFEASIPTPTPKPSSGGTEEVSLDDFGIDFSNSEFVSLDDFITPTEEKNDIIGDEPLDIQLTFDDNYALSTGANPLDEMETEFSEGFLPTGDDILDNFDDIFENVTDISEPEIKVEETVSDFTTSETVEFDSVSEFDDLLASLSDTSESSENIVEKQKENTETYQYDISVNLEEDEIIQDSTPEIDDNEEDFNVSLFSDEEFDNITSTQSANKIQGENTVEVSPMTNNNDSFFSIDDLDDSISFVDETPMDIDGIPVIDETPNSDSPSNIEDSDILADDIGLPPLDDNFFASTEELSEPIFPIETTFFDGDNPVFAEEETVQETEPVIVDEVATQTDDAFAMDDAFVSESTFAEEEVVQETEPVFTEEVATQTDDTFAMDDTFVSEPAFAEEEVVQETEPAFTEEVATQTDDTFAMNDAFVSEPTFAGEEAVQETEPTFAEEEAVQETEPVFTEEVATQTDDAFAMDDAFVSEPAFAEEEAVQETEPTFTEEVATQTDDAFAMDDTFVSEPVFAEEEAVQETEPTFTEEVATQTDDVFTMDDTFVSEPAFAEEEAVQETEPVFTEEVATQTDDAFAMNNAFVSEPTFAEEETEPVFVDEVATQTDDAFAMDDAFVSEPTFAEEEVATQTDDAFAMDDAFVSEPAFAEEEVVQETEPTFTEEVATQTDDAFAMDDAFVSEPVFAEEEVVQETEPTFVDEVATQTDDAFAMDDAFVSEPVLAEEETVQETEPAFTEEVTTQTDNAFAMDDTFVSEPAFAEEEAVQETEPAFTEEVATQTDDAFAMDDAFVSEPVFTEEEAVQETEPTFTEEVATQTDDAFAMNDTFVSEPVFAEEEAVQETDPTFTEEDDPFAVDEEQEVNESFLEEDVLEEEKDFAIEEALPTVASITAAALLAGATINTVSPFENEYEMDTTENVDKTPEMEYNESISPKEDTESMNENETSIDNMGNSLLEKIVNELSELRSEMASLKQELNTIKSTSEEQEKQVEEEIISIPESQSTGFFADDGEDETIALSGDELNNILNSADFTEEIVDESTVQEEITPESNISETEEMIENEVIENEITEESDSEEIAIEEDLISDDLSIDDSIIEENTIESQIEIQDADINQENEEIIIENDDDEEIQPDEILSVTDETFYDDDNSPALDISNEEIVEPELCNINFEDETENDIPQELPEEELADDFVVDSSTSDFLEENSTNSTDVVQEEIELVEDGNIEEEVAEVENDDILNALDEEDDFNDEPATEVFNSQWDSLDISSEDETDSQENDNPIAITMEELANARILAESQENEPVAPVVSEEVVSEKPASTVDNLSEDLKQDVKSVLEYMDKLLINLPEEKIKEFAASDHFEVYRKLFSELGLE